MVSPTQVQPTVSCPTCNKAVAWVAENRYRPFCSKRCKAIDLGAWAAEEYSIPVQPQAPDETVPD
ncbi:MAG: DNA gyrase inhibitor YacG [Proteobacteria bacterium]|nr:DNA gyrase inhibitor YacG [Pseudomonadota bacterium]